MADIIRFTDPANDGTVRLDISDLVSGDAAVDWGLPEGDRRRISFEIDIQGATKAALVTSWQNVIREIERCSSLEVRLEGQANSVWFDMLISEYRRPSADAQDRSEALLLYSWITGFQHQIRARLELVCDPYARGAELTPASAVGIANGPNASNFIDISSPVGDVEAPAVVELVYGTTPNRLLQRIARRTIGTVANFVSILEAESATLDGTTASQAEAAASNGNSTRTTPTNQNTILTHTWAVSTNLSDKRGAMDVYVKIKDRDTTPGQLKARLDLRLASRVDVVGDTKTITVDADHDGTTSPSYELWYLGTYHLPQNLAAHDWRLHLQRTVGTATVDVDYIVLLPADESLAILDFTSTVDITADTNRTFTIHTAEEAAWWGTQSSRRAAARLLGRGVWLKPGVTNRLIVQASADVHSGAGATVDQPPAIVLDDLTSITVRYRPRYRWIR